MKHLAAFWCEHFVTTVLLDIVTGTTGTV
jgi:hypothetical protein